MKFLSQHRYILIIIFQILILIPCKAETVAQQGNTSSKQLTVTLDSMRLNLPDDEFLKWLIKQGLDAESKDDVLLAWCYYSYYRGYKAIELMLHWSESQSQHEQMRNNLKYIQSFAVKHSARYTLMSELAHNCEIVSKGMLLNSEMTIQQSILKTGNRALIEQWNAVRKLKDMFQHKQADRQYVEADNQYVIARNIADTTRNPDLAAQFKKYDAEKMKIDSLYSSVDNHKRDIIRQLVLERNYSFSANFTKDWEHVRDRLSDRDALVEYFTYTADDGKTYYAALVLRPDSKYPQLVKISSEAVIKKQLEDITNGYFMMLWFTLWQPLEQYVVGAQNVFVVPTGVLSIVPFAALHYDNDYIADRYVIRNLMSSTDLIELDPTATTFRNRTALLVGGVDYDANLESKDIEHSNTVTSYNNMHNGLRAMQGQGFGYLSESLKEVQSIARKLANKWHTTQLTDTQATESNFRQQFSASSPEILHISTHGFYINNMVVENGDSKGNLFSVSNDPLMRSGLVLAGANSVWNNENETESINDGILTASEITTIDLSSTELAVLSACETGLGAIDGNEGVYGLQRSLRMAGVRSMLVSLWKIPDKETAQFMSLFYGLLAEDMSITDAFRATQREVRSRNPYSPNIWAGFVLIE